MPVEKGSSELPSSEDRSGPSPDDVTERHSDGASNEASNEDGAGSRQSTNNQVTTNNTLDGASGYTAPNVSDNPATNESERDGDLARNRPFTSMFPSDGANLTVDEMGNTRGLSSGSADSRVEIPFSWLLSGLAKRVFADEFKTKQQEYDKAVVQIQAFADKLQTKGKKMDETAAKVQELTERIDHLEKSKKKVEENLKKSQKVVEGALKGAQEGLASLEQEVTAPSPETNTQDFERSFIAPPVSQDDWKMVPGRLADLEKDVSSLKLDYNRYECLPDLVKKLTQRVELLEGQNLPGRVGNLEGENLPGRVGNLEGENLPGRVGDLEGENLPGRVGDLEQDKIETNDKIRENTHELYDDRVKNDKKFKEVDEIQQNVMQTQEVDGKHRERLEKEIVDVRKTVDEMNPSQTVQTQQPPAAGAAGGQQIDVADAADGDNEEVEGAQPVQEGQR